MNYLDGVLCYDPLKCLRKASKGEHHFYLGATKVRFTHVERSNISGSARMQVKIHFRSAE